MSATAGHEDHATSGSEETHRHEAVEREWHWRGPQVSGGNSSPVYGPGVIGAMVWFWKPADSPRGRVLAVFKAFVWPAFLVHDAFKAFRS